ncbi:unnamed protein product, partial [marine sediment metagenome]
AAISDDKWVSGSNSYGAQARGGSARSEVVISENPITYPHVIKADILIALSQSAYDKYIKNVSEKDSLVVYDDQMVELKDTKGAKQIAIPATKIAISELNSKQVANIVMLGASIVITGIVSEKSLISSIQTNVGQRFRELNLKALEVGYTLGKKITLAKSSKHNKHNEPNEHNKHKMAIEGRTHKPVIDRDLCQRCSVCVRACPAEYLPDLRYNKDTVRGYVYTHTDLPITEILPPCVGSCPLGQQVRDYVQLLGAGKVKEALLVIRQDNPLPGVCGYVCHHPCEQ